MEEEVEEIHGEPCSVLAGGVVVRLMLVCLVSANGAGHRPIRVSGRVLVVACCG